MTCRIKRATYRTVALAGLIVAWSPLTALAVACPGTLSANYTANQDVEKTTAASTPCFTSGVYVVNMAGHNIVCNIATGCDLAVLGFKFKNARIVDGTGRWSVGVQNPSGGVLEVTNVTVNDADYGVFLPAQVLVKIQNCVFKNIAYACVATDDGVAISGDGFIQQNFCDSAGDGISVATGPFVGIRTSFRRNYVRASGGTGIDASGANVNVEQNIIDQGDPFYSTGGTFGENVCDSDALCPDPGGNFSLTMDFAQ
jgi:hypothetical protein